MDRMPNGLLAYTDEVWAKYGAIFADRMKFNDPRGYSIVSMH